VFLTRQDIRVNHLQIKYLHPFHSKEVTEILRNSKHTICVECNYTGQFARHLRAETGFSVSDLILKYDGEPFEPHHIAQQVVAILEGQPRSLDVTMDEAREIAYHYIRVHLADKMRPARIEQVDGTDGGEPLWLIEVVGRERGEKEGELRVGKQTGSTFSWQPVVLSAGAGAD
jgi:hypothetical protein